MDFEQKFEFFKTRENTYTGPSCITDPKYGDNGQEIWSFG
jgi:hypothetical protein